MAVADLPGKGDLEGRTALITGASAGIGWAIARAYALAGARIVLVGRVEQSLRQRRDEIEELGVAADHVVADVTDASEVSRAVEAAASRQDGVDILVTSAGFSRPGAALTVSAADAHDMVNVGLLGTFYACQAAAAVMKERGYGKIITLGSTLGATVSQGTAVYASVKAAVSHLTRALAVEWAPHGIRVNCLAPTAVETPSRREMMSDDLRRQLLGRLPLGRFAEVADIVPAALYLAAPESDFVTGQTLYIDGGWTAQG
jgi:NAD(P)-dependent dehydrogenase (short-subunit alcohol dehydrogenase family)